jgi:hypothetical protein
MMAFIWASPEPDKKTPDLIEKETLKIFCGSLFDLAKFHTSGAAGLTPNMLRH